jgi:hypothetical protein
VLAFHLTQNQLSSNRLALKEETVNPQGIISVCEANWDLHQADCSGFVKAVASALGISTFSSSDNANAITDKLHVATDWTALVSGDGIAAKAQADLGLFLIACLRGDEQVQPSPNGHVVVVVSGPLDATHGKYPTAYWGRLGGVGAKAQTLNYAWQAVDRDRVGYFAKSVDAAGSG